MENKVVDVIFSIRTVVYLAFKYSRTICSHTMFFQMFQKLILVPKFQ